MNWKEIIKTMCFSTLLIAVFTANANETHIQKFVNKYCIDCHGEKKSKASVRFDNADFKFEKHASIYFWQDTLDVLNVGEMPPEDEKQPSNEELKNVIGEITVNLQIARKKLEATGGVISMRHLNRREYAGSIQDLFGISIPTEELPPDTSNGFDTNGSTQFFTSNHYESYFSVAQKTVGNAISNISKKYKQKTVRHDPEVRLNKLKKEQLEYQHKTMALFKNGANYKEAGFGDVTQANLFKKRYQKTIAGLEAYFKKPHIEVGATGPVKYSGSARPGSLYKISVEFQANSNSEMPIEVNHSQVAVVKITGQKNQNQRYEFTYVTDLLATSLSVALNSPKGGFIDNIKVAGPYTLKDSFFTSTFKKLILNPNATEKDVSFALTNFAKRAFRFQSVTPEYISKLMEIYRSDRKLGLNLEEAIIDPISAIISAPDFLYIKEMNNGKRQVLTQHEFAIRLAYFLWSSPPDERLYEKAKSGTLYDGPTLNAEIKRMLESPKADTFLSGFINQWGDLERFDEIDLPKQYQGRFQQSARKELSEFFKVLARENRPVDNLIDSDFVVVDSVLASFYKIKGDFDGFQKVALPKNSPRGGLLSQAAFLIMGTAGQRTSPTIRGTIIRERFLQDPPPPPPPNVPQIEANSKNPQTVREQVKKHKEVPQCASCHDKIDPIGFGLENFDNLGKWRTHETLGKEENKKKKGKKSKETKPPVKVEIDAKGYLSKSEKFDDFEGLKKVLYQKKDRLALSLYESLLAYGIGRDIEFVDEKEIKDVLTKLKNNNYKVRDMITSIVTSKTFMTK